MLDHDVVYLNGAQVKPSKEVKIGDKITICYLDHTQEFSVIAIPTTKSIPKSAKSLYVEEINTLPKTSTKEMFEKLFAGEMEQNEGIEFLTALYQKGESIEQIQAAVEVMRSHALKLDLPMALHDRLIDNCGTGGDKSGSFNISTTVSIVLATLGCVVAKHGNRSITSNSGSADMLEALGVKLDLTLSQLSMMLQESGFAFLFAQQFHPAMKYIMPIRKAIPHRTIFNLLGPLCNPADVKKQFVGVFDPSFVPKAAQVLQRTGSKRAMVVCGRDGLDELTLSDTSFVTMVEGQKISSYELNPVDYGFRLVENGAIKGGNAQENAIITQQILSGEMMGAKRDIVLLNAAAALVVDGRVRDIKEGIELSKEAIDSGKAEMKLEQIIKVSQTL